MVVSTLSPTPLPTISELAAAIAPSIASKQPGSEKLLSTLAAEAALAVMPKNPKDFNVDTVRVVKVLGGGLSASRVVKGMVFGREAEGELAFLLCRAELIHQVSSKTLQRPKSQSTLVVSTFRRQRPRVLSCSRRPTSYWTLPEEKRSSSRAWVIPRTLSTAADKQYFKEIADSGVKLIIAGSGIGDLALHYLNRMGIAVIKVLSKFDLRRLCRVVGATPLARLGAPTPEEAGMVDVFETIEIGGDRVTVLRQEDERTRTSTIVLRGATANYLDDLERTLDDGINTVRILLRDGRLVPGAGAAEIELASRISTFGGKTAGLAQHSIRRWAEAMEVVPRTLAENAGLNAEDVVSALYKAHADGQTDAGVDIDGEEQDGILSAKKAGILESFVAKDWAIKLATEAAVAVLRVDSIIVSKQAGIAPPKQSGHWDDD
jgi:T-complex protein 1 subunit theta